MLHGIIARSGKLLGFRRHRGFQGHAEKVAVVALALFVRVWNVKSRC